MDVTQQVLYAMEPLAFQRLALDALRAHLGPGVPLRVFDRAPGRSDGGFDGEILAPFDGLSLPIAVEAKRVADAKALRAEMRAYRKRVGRDGRSVVVVTSADLSRDEAVALEAEGGFRVFGGAEVASWVRMHPYLIHAHGLSGQGSWIRPLGAEPSRREDRPLFKSERSTVHAALDALGPGGTALILAAEPGASGPEVLEALVRALSRAGDPNLVPLLVGELPQGSSASRARALAEALGAGRAGARFLLGFDDPKSVREMMHAAGEATAHGWVVLTRANQAQVLDQLFRLTNVTPTTVPVRRVPLAELSAWAQQVLGATSKRHPDELDEAVFELRRGDLVELWVKDPSLLPVYLAAQFSPDVLRALAWVGLLDPLDGPTLDVLASALGVSRAEWVRALDEAARLALLDHDRGAWRPVGPGLRAVGVLASLLAGGLPPADVARVLDALPVRMAARALALLVELPKDAPGEPRTIVAERLQTWDAARLHEVLLTAPQAFGCSEACLQQAFESTAAWDTNTRLLVASALLRCVPAHPRLVVTAARWLRHVGLPRFPQGEIKGLVAPARIPAWAATSLLRELEAWMEALPPTLAHAADEMAVALADAAVSAWLGSAVEFSHARRMSVTYGHVAWRATHPGLVEAWTEAAALWRRMVRSPARDVAWARLSHLGQPTGQSQSSPPPDLEPILRDLLDDALRELADLNDWVDLALAETALVSVVRLPWAHLHARRVLQALRDEPAYLAFRAFALADGLVEDKARALAELDVLPDANPWPVLRTLHTDLESRGARIAARLVDAAVGTDGLLRILCAAADLLERTEPRGPWNRPHGHEHVMTAWCQSAPEVFEPLVLGDGWTGVPKSVLWRFAAATAGVFADRWSSVFNGDDAPTPGIALEVARFLRDPASFDLTAALAITRVLRGVVGRAELMATLHRLASYPNHVMREDLWWWLWHAVQRHPDLDRRDVEAVIRRLMTPPYGLETLGHVCDRQHNPLPIAAGSAWEAECFDALEAHLVLANHPAEGIISPNVRHALRPLLGRWFVARPEAWWQCVARDWQYVGGTFDADDLLYGVDEDALVAALRLAPVRADRSLRAARLVDTLVRRLSATRFKFELETLIEAEPERALAWLRARGMAEEAVEATVRLIPKLAHDDLETLVSDVSGDFGNTGFRESSIVTVDPFGDDVTPPEPSPVLARYREEARRRGGLVGETLERMASLAEQR